MSEDLEARLEELSSRVDESLARVRRWVPPLLQHAVTPTPAPHPASTSAELEELQSELRAAEANVNLQAQRSAALEDRIVELEAALVGAREQRARAEAHAESARADAHRALDELERAKTSGAQPPQAYDAGYSEALQAKLLEIERLTRERDALRRSADDWRSRARTFRRERDESSLNLERLSSQVEELRQRDAASRGRLADLEREVAEQQRELDIAERRAKHMRQHLTR